MSKARKNPAAKKAAKPASPRLRPLAGPMPTRPTRPTKPAAPKQKAKAAPPANFKPVMVKPSAAGAAPSVFELPAARFESMVRGATDRELMIARAALASVCRHWNVQADSLYHDHRRPHDLQARTRLCQALADHAKWSWAQIIGFLHRRSKSFVTDQLAQAKNWPIKDKYFTTRAERVERDVLAAIAEIDEAIAEQEPGAQAPGTPDTEGGAA